MKEKHTTDKIRIKGESGRFILFDPDSWQEIWITITQNRLRSFLTAFGIFWGIFMLVVMVGLGTGIQNSATSSLGHIAANTTLIFPSETTIPYKGFQKGRYWEFTTDDQFVMDKEFGDIEYQSAFIFGSSNDNNTVRKDKYGSYRVIGLEPQFNKIAPAKILKGRFLNELDIKEARKVCVVGTRVVNDLYGEEEDPIGTMLRINNIYYMVVGVAEAYSSNVNIFGNVEEQVNIPISTLQRSMNKGNKIDGLAVTAYEDIDIDGLEADIKQFLMRRHHVSPDDEDAIQSFSFKMILSSIQMLFVGLNALIWIVGLGTLLAGLIGVSNIMLVTVRERTQEIGIRRALGATPRVILTQVLSESVVLTTLSGVVGITVGAGVLALVGSVMGDGGSDSMMQDPQISFGVAIGALVILIVSGLFAGMLPTKRALQIKPIEALRDE